MPKLTEVRIFISSPGDVASERQRAVKVIEKVQTGLEERVKLTPISWDEKYYTAAAGFQPQIPPPSQTDIVLCILWKRLGSELPPQYDRSDGSHRTGTEWEFEDALNSAVQKEFPDILVYRKTEPVTFLAERVEAEQADLSRLESFWKKWFHNEQGHFTAGFQHFRDTDEFEILFEKHLRQWLADRCGDVVWPLALKGSPFRGLEPYDEDHAPVFYGRRRAIEEAKARLVTSAVRGCPFLLITGMSGSGKSSLARAGLGPRLQRLGAAPGVDRWRRAVMRPATHPGGPQRSLAESLFPGEALPELAAGDCAGPAELAACMAESPQQAIRSVGRALDRVAAAMRTAEGFEREVAVRLLLIVDQLEELLQSPPAERDAFAALLAALCREGRIWVVATLRSDFYQQFKDVPALWELKDQGGQYPLSPPGPAEIREIIQGPALAAGLAFETDAQSGESLDEILERGASGPGYLPLLQFTLERLFDLRDQQRNVLLQSAYASLGGIEGSIRAHAEAIFQTLDEPARAALPRVLLRLATVRSDASGSLISRSTALAGFAEGSAERRLIAALLAPQARLLVCDGEGEAVNIRVAHEALFSHWDKAKAILDAARPALLARARLGQAAALWEAEGKRPDLLWTSAQLLLDAKALLTKHALSLDAWEQEFLEKSLARSRRNTWLKRAAVAGLVALTLVSVAGVALSLDQLQRANRQTRLALAAFTRLAFDLPIQLANIPGMFDFAKRTLEDNVGLLNSILELEPETPSTKWQRSNVLTRGGDTWLTLGDTEAAKKWYQMALEIDAREAANQPDDTDWQRNLSIKYQKIGDVLQAEGDTAGALTAYRQALGIQERLAATDPKNTEWQRGLSISHESIGNILQATGDTAGALNAYWLVLKIREQLAATDPKNSQWQLDMSYTKEKIGSVLEATGKTAGALNAYQQALEIRERLAATDPKNSQRQRDLSVSQNKIGDMLQATGDTAGALAAYRQSLKIAERLAAADPKNGQWQRDLSISKINIGIILQATGDIAGALTAYRQALEILERLAAAEPQNDQWRKDVEWVRQRIAKLKK
ncbi:MAG: hypothetical protein B193_1987 [Solidesulfovibrio magneticus str. Maddingley MBC34]|uniref:Novel STAND NTPase 1 domain-containing protein n=1 Tax=Solidesulfovibrio magneticus str. Maddingley MBC34 TaxID=1206767 RepID=K6GQS5_9BACT|nr:MAG: hypothetical protein B193_1987 [Solidesulfovibrio magneticus str. Maddingley MBC34]